MDLGSGRSGRAQRRYERERREERSHNMSSDWTLGVLATKGTNDDLNDILQQPTTFVTMRGSRRAHSEHWP